MVVITKKVYHTTIMNEIEKKNGAKNKYMRLYELIQNQSIHKKCQEILKWYDDDCDTKL